MTAHSLYTEGVILIIAEGILIILFYLFYFNQHAVVDICLLCQMDKIRIGFLFVISWYYFKVLVKSSVFHLRGPSIQLGQAISIYI